jgi:formylglycine-generating enzyme
MPKDLSLHFFYFLSNKTMLQANTERIKNCEFEMLHVAGGIYLMGSTDEDKEAFDREKPAHKVKISDFFITKYPVTQALWKDVMNNENPSHFKGDDLPVENVSYDDITQKFLPALQKMTNLPFRLPTEAEWEYAARGGIYHEDAYKYAGSDRLKDVAWYDKNSEGQTKPVGLKQANQLGIHDLSGNVFEWCNDWFGDSAYYEECRKNGIVNDPQGLEKGSNRVCRGGGWHYDALFCRTAYRYYNSPDYRGNHLGFRLALSLQADGCYSAIPVSKTE